MRDGWSIFLTQSITSPSELYYFKKTNKNVKLLKIKFEVLVKVRHFKSYMNGQDWSGG